jgi:predicted protein tyrosine phosphatase
MSIAIPSLLTVCGLDELESHGTRGVTHVLSILDPEQPDPDFGRYPPHVRTLLRFHDIIDPTPGMVLPSVADVEAILAFGRAVMTDGAGAEAHLLVHCHAGISRSTAAMTSILAQAHPERDEPSIVEQVFDIRAKAWPNLLMIGFADDLLGRGGRLTEAVKVLYRRHLARRPELAEAMTKLGRGREVAIGLGREAPAV